MFSHFRKQRSLSGVILVLALLSITLVDELTVGFPTIGLPLLRVQLHLDYTQLGLLFTLSMGIAALLKPIASLLSDRGSKRWWVIGGLVGMAVGYLVASAAHNFPLLLLAFIIIDAAGGVAIGLSQAALIDVSPTDSTRTMAQWTLAGSIGDLSGPLIITLLLSLHADWAQLCWMAAIFWGALLCILLPQRFPRLAQLEDEESFSFRALLAGLRDAVRNPTLLRWVALSLVPSMVDEVFLSFSVLYLHDILHASALAIGLIVTLQMLTGALSLLLLERTLLPRFSNLTLLRWQAILTLVGMLVFLSSHTFWVAGGALCVIGMCSVGWYPIAKGEAYATLPGHSGTVRAVASLGEPFEMALPGIVGLLAGTFGLLTGLGFLASAPLLILVLTIGQKRRS